MEEMQEEQGDKITLKSNPDIQKNNPEKKNEELKEEEFIKRIIFLNF